MNNTVLFERFAKDIIYDCHSLRARVSRSSAGKQILARGPDMLGELAEHLKNYRPPTEIEAIAREVKHGWGILLSSLCEEHSLNRRGIAQANFDAWVNWLSDFQVPA